MFKSKRTKIVSLSIEEPVLEVLDEGPELEQLVALKSFVVKGNVEYIYYGTFLDYNGLEYDFEWDVESNRLSRLVGSQVSSFIWSQAVQLLTPQFVRMETSLKDEMESLLSTSTKNVVDTLVQGLQGLDTKLDKLKIAPAPVIPTPVVSPPKAQLRIVEEVLEPEVTPEDDELSLRALEFLQESNSDDLEVDYLSL